MDFNIMKSFTIKDLLLHYCPCYCCKSQMKVFIGSGSNQYKTTAVKQNILSCRLYKKYHEHLDLNINLTTNAFFANNNKLLSKWLTEHPELWILIQCEKCISSMESEKFTLNLDTFYIKPIFVSYESLFLNEHNAHTYSSYVQNIEYCEMVLNYTNTPKTILPPKPLWSFNYKTKDKLLDKIKTYTIFS